MANSFQDCVILFGDSLTERQDVPQALFERMCQAYARKLDILNRGFGGYTSTGALPLFDEIFAQKGKDAPRVRLVTLWFGTNDSVHFPNPRATHPTQFKNNYKIILDHLTSPESPFSISQTPVHILLITPPPPYLPQVPLPAKWVRSEERSLEFVNVVRDLGKEYKTKETGTWTIEVLDLWKAMEFKAGGLGDGLAPFFHDGCHMTPEGYGVLWEEYRKIVSGPWQGHGLDWEDENDLPMRVPSVRTIDHTRPDSVLELLGLPSYR
ncbi:hypothetical protein V865_001788 [Kwoniella europaea PYCC6329]|uniref:SGNH hydrolase-type esterase domain-containing protein n=1 Tax=Kwoniella europaea PYCC6329 TaxID=1423913 RepID=A0AAX4KBA2_9TREE